MPPGGHSRGDDHRRPPPRTARAIAAQAGIANDRVITGDELVHMPPQVLADEVRQVSVFARIKPHQKLALVEALKGVI